jgi:hypothetical protein
MDNVINSKSDRKNDDLSKKQKRLNHNWKIIVIALYITFLILTSIPFLADRAIEPNIKDKYEYHISYPSDGRQTHYYVEREDTGSLGRIDITYTTASNSLNVKSTNIEVLHIYCRSMYEDECKEVFGIDPADNYNYYKWFFLEKNHLSVNVETDSEMTELAFIDTPIPYQVIVNGLKWEEGKQYNFTNSYGIVISHVPKGSNQVDIYFKTQNKNRPHASLTSDSIMININTLVNFDASSSYDLDGKIISYIWDYGDGNKSGGMINAHSWSNPGEYSVILTVRDDDFLIDHAILNISVVMGTNQPVINGIVPDQQQNEDDSAWELDLNGFGIDLDSSPTELRWYLTGENVSLYHVLGENSTDQKLVFSPILNAYGNDLTTLWLKDKDGYNTSQPLWINLTSVNDKPIIEGLPPLNVHYGVPYRFTITNYLYDVETPKEELIIWVQDKFGNQYVKSEGHEIITEYPESLANEVILVSISVSDGEDTSEYIISVEISDNWPPVLTEQLPDIVLYEGTAKYDAFNLDDYFMDPEENELYYTYSKSNIITYIKANNSVDIISQGDWTGEEEVIFRARDPYDGFVEDVIKIIVLPINDPPKIGDVPNLMVHYDLDYNFDISYYIADSDNSLSELTLTSSDKEHIRINPLNHLGIILNYPKSMLGTTINVRMTVSDGNLETTKMISVTVIEEYPPELIQKLPDVTFNEDESLIDLFDLDEYFLDFDNDSLYYTTGNKMVNVTIDPLHSVSFFVLKDWFGIEKVIFRATDPIGALVEDSIYVTVLPINDPPGIKALPDVILNKTEILELDLKPYIFDVDNNVSELNITVSDPSIMVSGTSLIIFGSPDLESEIEIYITDGESITIGDLNIKVIDEPQQREQINSGFYVSILVLIIIIIAILIGVYIRHRKQQKFDIQEIFLIHNSGKLVNHLYLKSHSKFDEDIFSGMFTAIQEFIEDSFTRDPKQPRLEFGSFSTGPNKSEEIKPGKNPLKLNEFKVGDNQVIIEHGKFLFMAVVYTGPGVNALHRVIWNSINNIEVKYGGELEFWDGDIKKLVGIKDYLEQLLPDNKLTKATSDNLGKLVSIPR